MLCGSTFRSLPHIGHRPAVGRTGSAREAPGQSSRAHASSASWSSAVWRAARRRPPGWLPDTARVNGDLDDGVREAAVAGPVQSALKRNWKTVPVLARVIRALRPVSGQPGSVAAVLERRQLELDLVAELSPERPPAAQVERLHRSSVAPARFLEPAPALRLSDRSPAEGRAEGKREDGNHGQQHMPSACLRRVH
jgi:hypothetical protein